MSFVDVTYSRPREKIREGVLLDQPLALVLSGGSVRAAAHVGVLKALIKYHLEPDLVVGTSGGAIVAALYAAGRTPDELEELFLAHLIC